MASVGRPHVLDDAKRREICALVTAGYGLLGAAEYVGCSVSTIRREAKRNLEFCEKLRQAFLASELDIINSVRKTARSNWRAAAWYLERVNPERYAKTNPKLLKPGVVREFIEMLVAIINSELSNPDEKERVGHKIAQMFMDLTNDDPVSDKEILTQQTLPDAK